MSPSGMSVLTIQSADATCRTRRVFQNAPYLFVTLALWVPDWSKHARRAKATFATTKGPGKA